jgi:hypothetical protein
MKRWVGVFFIILCGAILIAQDTPEIDSDAQVWGVLGIDIEVHPIFKIYLEKQYRYQTNFSDLRSDIYEVGGRLRLTGFAAIRGNYRYTIRENDKRYRFDANLQLDFRIKDFSLDTRTRIQSEYIEDNIFNASESELRNRLRVTYRPRGSILRPYIAVELFHGLGENKRERNKLRMTFGSLLRLKSGFSIKMFFHYQTDTVSERSQRRYIFGTKFNYSF